MDAQPLGDGRPPTDSSPPHTPSQGRRQHAPSLDAIATPSSAAAGLPAEAINAINPGAASAMMQESRSSSSTNSPLPFDNAESDFFIVGNDSESSLGVPQLQDVHIDGTGGEGDPSDAESEDCIVPPINRLPNEILMFIFSRLSSHVDLLNCILACKRWARNSVDLLWHRPACTNWQRHQSVCQTLTVPNQYFPYKDFIKRLNLASIAEQVNDGSVMALAVCNRIERLTLTNCKQLTDTGLMALVQNSSQLLALDISYANQITEATVFSIAQFCKRLQGLNVTGCTKISNEGMIALAENCKYIKRIKLNDCAQITDETVSALANNCPNILEIDLQNCRLVTNTPITELMTKGQALRELRLTCCELIDDSAFLNLPDGRIYEHLRILDLTSCINLTDSAVERIINVAPRLRNLVLAKCRNITDSAVISISRLGKNLHYLHLGHCVNVTDEAVKRLVNSCNRIRYIDLGCCTNLTDDSVMRLATLPKLKRIGLVKCSNITDESVYALARANQRRGQRREQYDYGSSGMDADGNVVMNGTGANGPSLPAAGGSGGSSSLERVHLSYCSLLSIRSIIRLLNACTRLTHLSLTGVAAFLRDDLARFCRSPPPEFTVHQREMFCVFSGEGVSNLRKRLNEHPDYADFRDRPTQHHFMSNVQQQLNGPGPDAGAGAGAGIAGAHQHNGPPFYGAGLLHEAALATFHQIAPPLTDAQRAHAEHISRMQSMQQQLTPTQALWQHIAQTQSLTLGEQHQQQQHQQQQQQHRMLAMLQHQNVRAQQLHEQPQIVSTHLDADGETVNDYADDGIMVDDASSDMLVDATIGSHSVANSNINNHHQQNMVPPPPPPAPQVPPGAPTPSVLPSTPTLGPGRPFPFPPVWRPATVNPNIDSDPRSTPATSTHLQPVTLLPSTPFAPSAPPTGLTTPTLFAPVSMASAAPIRAGASTAEQASGASSASLSGAVGQSMGPEPSGE